MYVMHTHLYSRMCFVSMQCALPSMSVPKWVQAKARTVADQSAFKERLDLELWTLGTSLFWTLFYRQINENFGFWDALVFLWKFECFLNMRAFCYVFPIVLCIVV